MIKQIQTKIPVVHHIAADNPIFLESRNSQHGENKIGVCRVAVAGIGCCGLWVEPPLEYRTAPLQVAWAMKNAL